MHTRVPADVYAKKNHTIRKRKKMNVKSVPTSISLSGKRVCDSPSIRVSETSVYYENRRGVPTLGKHLFTLHFAKACTFSIVAQQITWRHNRNSNKSQIITVRYSFPFRRKSPVICYFEKGVEFENHIKISRLCANGYFIHKRPSNPNTVWKLRLSAFCMCYYFLLSYWCVR